MKAGYAWWFFKYSDDEQLGILEVQAKIAKVGLWVDKNSAFYFSGCHRVFVRPYGPRFG